MIGDDVPGEWLVDRFAAAADPARLIIADATGRHAGTRSGEQVLGWSRTAGGGGVSADEARAELAEADRRVGTDG